MRFGQKAILLPVSLLAPDRPRAAESGVLAWIRANQVLVSALVAIVASYTGLFGALAVAKLNDSFAKQRLERGDLTELDTALVRLGVGFGGIAAALENIGEIQGENGQQKWIQQEDARDHLPRLEAELKTAEAAINAAWTTASRNSSFLKDDFVLALREAEESRASLQEFVRTFDRGARLYLILEMYTSLGMFDCQGRFIHDTYLSAVGYKRWSGSHVPPEPIKTMQECAVEYTLVYPDEDKRVK